MSASIPFNGRKAGNMTKHLMVMAAVAGAVTLAAAVPAMAKSVCIRSYDIDHTAIPDDNTILFYMRGHKVFKANLINRCVGLRINSHGFSYSPTDPGTDELCSNLLTIRLNDTAQPCLVGEITPLEMPAAKASP
jgi:hypothetical protein